MDIENVDAKDPLQEIVPALSIVIPVRDEKLTIGTLSNEIKRALIYLDKTFEIIFIDDHSSADSIPYFEALKKENNNVRIITLTEERGKDSALVRGFREARGKIIITMDGDGQNDPDDIGNLLAALNDYDMVCGIRKKRNDSLEVRISSIIANWFRIKCTGDKFVDAGCALKAIRQICVDTICHYTPDFFGTAHCFYPSFLTMHGLRVTQIPVNHRPRMNGKSKFRAVRGRLVSGIRACLLIRKLKKHQNKILPISLSQTEKTKP